MSQQCKCKRGYASLIDGKCSNCRTKKEQAAWLARPSKQLIFHVVNKHHGETGIYIGRGSPLGNPFPIQGRDTRDVVIEKYEVWLKEQIRIENPTVIRELNTLGTLVMTGPLKLQCFCAPQACHGHVIVDVLFNAISKTYPDTHWWK